MTFLRIMFVKDYPYLYRQTNVRSGKQVKSYCTYLGPVAGGVPWGVRSRPRKLRGFGETRTPRVDVTDPRECQAISEQITLGTAIAAERLEREKRRRGKDHGKWERSVKRLRTRSGPCGCSPNSSGSGTGCEEPHLVVIT